MEEINIRPVSSNALEADAAVQRREPWLWMDTGLLRFLLREVFAFFSGQRDFWIGRKKSRCPEKQTHFFVKCSQQQSLVKSGIFTM